MQQKIQVNKQISCQKNFSSFLFFFFFYIYFAMQFIFYILDQLLDLVLSAIHHKRFRFYSCSIIYPEAIIRCLLLNDKTPSIFYLYTYSCSVCVYVISTAYFWFVYLCLWFKDPMFCVHMSFVIQHAVFIFIRGHVKSFFDYLIFTGMSNIFLESTRL